MNEGVSSELVDEVVATAMLQASALIEDFVNTVNELNGEVEAAIIRVQHLMDDHDYTFEGASRTVLAELKRT